MSSSLYWEAVKPPRAHTDLDRTSDSLKLTLRNEYGYPLDITFTEDNVPFLRGMAAAGLKDADKLCEHILKHDTVRVWEE